ncbi:MAG: hypothetical protein IPM47_04490 [Sphingobacteriales bacterium]|nr:MAG: hypothetical protein IPM47_04490 [Sphingobacteriales bacterium]
MGKIISISNNKKAVLNYKMMILKVKISIVIPKIIILTLKIIVEKDGNSILKKKIAIEKIKTAI